MKKIVFLTVIGIRIYPRYMFTYRPTNKRIPTASPAESSNVSLSFDIVWWLRVFLLLPIGSMVLLYIYMVTWIPSIYPLYVSIYTSTMDPMGYSPSTRSARVRAVTTSGSLRRMSRAPLRSRRAAIWGGAGAKIGAFPSEKAPWDAPDRLMGYCSFTLWLFNIAMV